MGGVIPEHEVVIFDEAHQLEEIATDFFGVRVSSARIETMARDAKRTVQALRLGNETTEALARIDAVVAASQAFFAVLARDFGGLARDGETRARLPEDAFRNERDEVLHRRGRLDAALEALAKWASLKERSEELGVLARRATSVRDDLARVSAPGREEVAWIEVRARSCAIGVSPIDLAPVFRDELFAHDKHWPRSAVLTSATLAVHDERDPFRHAKRRLGIAYEVLSEDDDGAPLRETRHSCDTSEIIVPSPFDFARRAGVYVPVDLPEPNDPSFLDRAGSRVLDLVKASRGGAFVLCASARNMRALHALLQDANLPWPLLCQGERPKFQLLADFREAGNAILVATMGFWEGVDVPGRALRLVVIDKLPFAVPTDPVTAARHRAIEEEGRSSFAELSVPNAAISLKQGFGRLIRTGSDAGVVAILDKRLRTKGYGRSMRASLPPASPLYDLAQVRAFFEVVIEPAHGEA
jgi:ATP-dependent DNA helicase DinG